MQEIIFVTYNKGKIASAQRKLKEVNFKIYEYELEEPRSDDITYISKYKVMEAYKLVNKTCGYDKTLAQMTEEERSNRIKYDSIDSMVEFTKWYREQKI